MAYVEVTSEKHWGLRQRLQSMIDTIEDRRTSMREALIQRVMKPRWFGLRRARTREEAIAWLNSQPTLRSNLGNRWQLIELMHGRQYTACTRMLRLVNEANGALIYMSDEDFVNCFGYTD